MSIAEKLTTVAENQQKVYDAGHKAAIERYAPEFTESGASVVCYPVEGFPIKVVSQITPIQAGSGEPSPTNVRPITGHTSVTVHIENENGIVEQTAQLGQNVYAGSFDWSTGLLTLTHKMLTLTGEGDDSQTDWHQEDEQVVINYYHCGDAKQGTTALVGWCSHVPTTSDNGTSIAWDVLRKGYVGGYLRVAELTTFWGLPDSTVATWLDFLKAQAAAGTPVQILYELETPITVQLTPQEILALAGTNTVYSDTGDTTVKGKGDGVAMVEELKEIIISLGGEI